MKRTDIIGALKIASEKGGNIEKIKASLISAGYAAQDVEDSAQAFSQGASPYAKPQPKPLPVTPEKLQAQPSIPKEIPSEQAMPVQQPMQENQITELKHKVPPYLLIAIVICAIIVAGLLGYVVYTIISG